MLLWTFKEECLDCFKKGIRYLIPPPIPETIMSEDTGSNNVRRFMRCARSKQSMYIKQPIYSTAYAKWEARAELVTAYFVTVLNRNIQLMTENLVVEETLWRIFLISYHNNENTSWI